MSFKPFPGERPVAPISGESRTKQADLPRADINTIVRKYQRQDVLPTFNRRTPRYGDFSNAGDYLTAVIRVQRTQEMFDSLPSHVRSACDNDPAKLLELAFDPAREDELRKLGLLPPAERPADEVAVAGGSDEPAVAPPEA